jgi:chitodextrinase
MLNIISIIRCNNPKRARRAPGAGLRVLVLGLTGISGLFANTYYVATNGSDSNSGTTSAPFKTINKGINAASAGDTVYVRGGSYYQTAYISKSGTSSALITIAGYPGEAAIIDGQDTLPSGGTSHLYDPLVSVAGNYIKIQDLTIQNSYGMGLKITGSNNIAHGIKSYGNGENGILVNGGSYNVVEDSELINNCKWHVNGQSTPDGYWASGLSAARNGTNHTTIRRNKVSLTWGEGISSYEATDTIIEDNIVWNNWQNIYISDTQYVVAQRNMSYCTPGNPIESLNQQNAFLVDDEVSNPPSAHNTIVNNFTWGCVTGIAIASAQFNDVVVANNTFVNANNPRSGSAAVTIYSTGTPSNARFQNNIIVQDDSKPILSGSTSGITFSNNIWSKTPTSSALGSSSLVADPQLARTGSTSAGAMSPDWFKVVSSSPAIHKAMSLSQVTVDFFSSPRGSTPDAGGHQFVSGGTSDGTAPSTPAGLSANAVSASEIDLSWTASSDNTGVSGYRVSRGGTQIANVTSGSSYKNTGLSASTTYTYTVAAYDAAGNVSSPSVAVSATTQATQPAGDSSAPTTPSGLSGSAASTSAINLSWAASNDNVGVTGYRVYRGGAVVGTATGTGYQDSGLSASTAYNYTVAAFDAAGNVSSQSSPVSVTTQATQTTQPSTQPIVINVRILNPTSGMTVRAGSTVQLKAVANSNYPMRSIVWQVDGQTISSALTVTSATSTIGTANWTVGGGRWHTILVTAMDSTRTTATYTLRIYSR